MAAKKKKENVVFINITIQDASLAVKEKVKGKLEKLPKHFQNQAAHAASYFTTRGKAAQILSQRFCKELPDMFGKKGISITVEEVFREGPYIVLKLVVLNVDSQAIDRNWLRWFTWNIGFKEKIEENLLPNLVTKHITETMPALVDKKMAKIKITAETKVNNRKNQEKYFQMKLEEISDELEMRKQNTSLRKLRRVMSLPNINDSKKMVSIEEESESQSKEQSSVSTTESSNNLRAKLKKRFSGISSMSSFESDKENSDTLDLTADEKPSRWRRLRGDRSFIMGRDSDVMEV